MRSFKTWSSRLLLAGLALLAALGPARAAWSLVQAAHNVSFTTNAYTVTFGASLTAGNLVVCEATWGTTNTADLTSFTIGAASAVLSNARTDSSNSQSFVMGYFINNPGGTTTLGVNGTAAAVGLDSIAICAEYTNTGVSGATFDTGASAVGVLGAAGTATLGTAIGASGDLIVGFIIEDTTPGTLTAGAGFTTDLADNNDGNFFGLSTNIESAKGAASALTPTWTTGAGGSFLIGGLSFAVGGGPPPSTCGSLPLLGAGC